MKIASNQDYIKFLNKKLKYDLMGYKFLKCNMLCSVETLDVFIRKDRYSFSKKKSKKKKKYLKNHPKILLIRKTLIKFILNV